MQAAVLRGTQDGYDLVIKQSASLDQVMVDLKTLLENLKADAQAPTERVSLDVLTEDRILTPEEKHRIEQLVGQYPRFEIHKITANVMTIADALQLKERENVHLLSKVIRNGQDVQMQGDVLFLGTIHEGGKLCTTGNIFSMGNVTGILQAGYPDDESKLVMGNLQTAQQVRIAEQFDIVEQGELAASQQTIAYVNDLHVLSYGNLNQLKKINPKLYNQIGGI
ncbi:septum site-determining protein MinC [Levilactobacillus zymae]|uniref:Septum site-determining protein MinC n=1 Tax=Levilactobacillus zymae TaxID=267363 RepID=A0A1Y6JXS0_9LACO|nr:septum site-determining protein MinC [Levilactobacillus zymae]KRL10653.1 septum formation inhibitor [Levilactobacillus zymae DSM 19395]QFR60330.1 cell division inhibitor [Levilactobacillus zymae]GEO71220.1 septum site-determining protein MinC [Levilactobacillus zymae]SMS14645.1 Septum site-determining protein MinC [Levilactobacillus zymae]